MPIQPKSSEELLKDLDGFKYDIPDGFYSGTEAYHIALRHWVPDALASYALYLKGKLPRRVGDMFPGISAIADGEELAKARQRGMEHGYDIAINSVHTMFDDEITKLTE